jgi:predicted NBD/HSP70 family sugar kinase
MPFEVWSWAEEIGAPSDHLDKWREANLESRLRDRFGLPVYACNDITAACGAEMVFGDSGRFRESVYFYVGTFVGGGVVLEGSLFPGRSGNAGALGSMLVPDRHGGVQQLIRCASIYRLELQLAAVGASPDGLWKSSDCWTGPREVIDDWLEATGRALAIAAISACAVLDFEAVVIDGALPSVERTRLVEVIRQAISELERQGLSPFEVVEGTIGTFARALGGACLPLLANFAADRDVLFKDLA